MLVSDLSVLVGFFHQRDPRLAGSRLVPAAMAVRLVARLVPGRSWESRVMTVLVPLFGVPGSWKRSAAGVGAVVALAVGLTGFGLVAAPVSVADDGEPVSCSVERTAPDTVSATLNARLSGCRIEDLSQRTETSSTFARPDGDWDITYAMSPVWVRTGGDGTATEDWAALNADLRTDDDGDLEPTAHPAGIWVSGKQAAGQDGVSVVASLTDPKTEVASEVTWPGDLPEPEVTGPRARYVDVEPGVDMVVDVTGGGIEQYFVLHDVPADATQVELPVGVHSEGATVVDTSQDARTTGLADLVAAHGDEDESVVAQVGVPLVWDATYDEQLAHPVLADYDPADEAPLWAGAISDLDAAESEAEEPGLLDKAAAAVTDAVNGEPEPLDLGEVSEATAQVDVASGGESADIRLGLSDDFAEAAGDGPVVVDPSVSLALPWDTYVQSDSSADKSTETELRLGTFDGGTTKARTFMNVNVSQIIGKSIRSATLKMWEHHSYSCTPTEWQVWNASRVLGAITWDSQPTMGTKQASSTETKGHSAPCDDGWVTMDMTSLAKAWASDTATERGMALRAASETDSAGWKRFNSTNAATGKPTITVTVNTAPATPGPTSLASGNYNWYPSSSATDRELYVKTLQPQFSTVVSDPDGDRVRSAVGLAEGTTAVLTNGVGSYVASGGTSKYTTAAGLLTHGHTYSANVRSYDGLLSSARKDLWSFKVDTAKPATPSVTASGYTEGQWKDTKPTSNTFTFTDTSTDVVRFEYSLDGGPWTSVAATGTSPKTATLAWNPANGAHTIKVRAIDKAAWASAETIFKFGSGGPAISAPTSAGTKTTSTALVEAVAPAPASGGVSAHLLWRVGGAGEPGDFSQTNGSRTGWEASNENLTLKTVGATVSTRTTLDVAAIAAALQRERKATRIEVQVCFTYTSPVATRCSWTGTASSHATATYVPHAFGDQFPTAEAGPGEVALWTGEFALSADDLALPALSVGRSYATFDAPSAGGGVFGPGWTTDLSAAYGDGVADLQVLDDTLFDGTLSFTDGISAPITFVQPPSSSPGTGREERKIGTYTPVDADSAAQELQVEVSGSSAGAGTVLTVTGGGGIVTEWRYVSGGWRVHGVRDAENPALTLFSYDAQGRVTRILAEPPTDAGQVTCEPGAEERGCQALSVSYGTANVGTDAAPGDRLGQVKEIAYTAWSTGTGSMATTIAARYKYNGAGLLVEVADPRSTYATRYTYSGVSSAGVPLLMSIARTGMDEWKFQYGTTTLDSKALVTVSRADVRMNRYVYGIDPAVATTGLPSAALWEQNSTPSYGAAVFEMDKAQEVSGSKVENVTADQWPYATLTYADDDGRSTHAAEHSDGAWQVTSLTSDSDWPNSDSPMMQPLLTMRPQVGAAPFTDYAKEYFTPGEAVVFVAGATLAPGATSHGSGDSILSGAAAANLAVTAGAPLLLTHSEEVPTETADALAYLAPKRIVVVGGTDEVSASTFNELATYATSGAERLGSGHLEPSAAASASGFPNGALTAIVTATGSSLSVGHTASEALTSPVLTVAPGATTLTAGSMAELNRLRPSRIIVVGGTASITTQVASQLGSWAPVTRIGTNDPEQTAIALSAEFSLPDTPVLYVAHVANHGAMLAASYGAALEGGTVLGVSGSAPSQEVRDEIARLNPERVGLVGPLSDGLTTELAAAVETVPYDAQAAALLDHLAPAADAVLRGVADEPTADGQPVSVTAPSGDSVTLPGSAHDPVTMALASGGALSITVPHEGANDASVAIADGIVGFKSSDATSSVAVAKTDGSVQFNTIVDGATSPERFTYEVGLPAGATAELIDGGGVLFASSTGEFLGGLTPPWATDADGESLTTWYEVEGTQVTQVVKHRDTGAVYPVVADPWLGRDLFGYTGYNRKGTWDRQVVVSAKLSGWGWYWYTTGSGQAILHTAGWSELLRKRPQADDKATLKQQYKCHVVFGYAVWLAGLHWDLEKARPNKTNWFTSAPRHKCNWN